MSSDQEWDGSGWDPKTPGLEAANRRATAVMEMMYGEQPPKPLRRGLPGPYVAITKHDPPLVLQIGLSDRGKLICTGLLIGW